MSSEVARRGQPIPEMPLLQAAPTTRLFWPGRFLLAASPRPGESCTDGDHPVA